MASERPRRVAILTSGGDAPGMNAVVRAAVRAALEKGLEIFAVEEGFQGLVEGGQRIRRMGWNDVGGILAKGGTVIGTARCPAFRTREGRLAAARNVARERIDALIVVGGDGSLTGADLFRREWPGLLKELAARGEIASETVKAAAPLALVGLVGLDRQRHGRHRHDDRRRHGAPPGRRGGRRPRVDRREPPEDVRRRGHGAQLRLPRPHERPRHGCRVGFHSRGAAGRRRLGGEAVRRPCRREASGPSALDRHPRGRGGGPAGKADRGRADSKTPRGEARDRDPDDRPRPRPAGRGAERLRPDHGDPPRRSGGGRGPAVRSRRSPVPHRPAREPDRPRAVDGKRREGARGGRGDPLGRFRPGHGAARDRLPKRLSHPEDPRPRLPARPPRRAEAAAIPRPPLRRSGPRHEHGGPRRRASARRPGARRSRRPKRLRGSPRGRRERAGLDERPRLGLGGRGRARDEPQGPRGRGAGRPGRGPHRSPGRRHPPRRRLGGLPGGVRDGRGPRSFTLPSASRSSAFRRASTTASPARSSPSVPIRR